MTKHPTTPQPADERRAALKLLRAGLATPSDVAALAGVSRQVVNYWLTAAGIDWQAAYRRRIAREWRRALRR